MSNEQIDISERVSRIMGALQLRICTLEAELEAERRKSQALEQQLAEAIGKQA